ncbi:metalloproteinase 5 [Coccidioides immitis RS]|uniref:Neutral protease 2 n=1 Tax=Coccidioides immitis (strain RS) TaxID=246410 RepID=J3KAE7_COCIM|nr:metalloproteinase 5 [Coccidioides immitis RS]EAS31986.3 metalloproteinase 5 [Coccidioides immitis RS]
MTCSFVSADRAPLHPALQHLACPWENCLFSLFLEMRLSSSLIALAALAVQALALPVNELAERDTGLDVKLIPIGNTRVKAIITNNADHEMSFVKYNTLFDSSPVRKVQISKDGSIVPFNGMRLYYDINNLPKEAYKTLAPGASAEAEFDIAETSDLSAGGSFEISAEGSIPVIDGQGTKPTGSIRFKANVLTMDIDGEMASKVASAIPELDKRTRVDGQTCTGQYAQLLQGGLRNCVTYAQRAAQAASGGNAQKFQEYFKTTSQQARQSVARRFQAIAQECSSANQGRTIYFCQDVYRNCQRGLIAYTIPARSHVVNCPDYWRLPPVVNRGLDPDHGYVVVHEFTHATSIFSPGTVDHAYGYEQCRRLNAQQSLSNADNYSLFAADVTRN